MTNNGLNQRARAAEIKIEEDADCDNKAKGAQTKYQSNSRVYPKAELSTNRILSRD